jgi:hypothetical protein
MKVILPEKKFKRLVGEFENKEKPSRTTMGFWIFLVILFLISYIFFHNIYFA